MTKEEWKEKAPAFFNEWRASRCAHIVNNYELSSDNFWWWFYDDMKQRPKFGPPDACRRAFDTWFKVHFSLGYLD